MLASLLMLRHRPCSMQYAVFGVPRLTSTPGWCLQIHFVHFYTINIEHLMMSWNVSSHSRDSVAGSKFACFCMWKLKQWLPGSNGRQEDTIVKDWWLLRAINSCLITALSNDFEGLWSFLLSYFEISEPELWCGWSTRPMPRCLAAVASCTSCQRGKIERSCLTRGSHVAVKSHLFTCTNGLIPFFFFLVRETENRLTWTLVN